MSAESRGEARVFAEPNRPLKRPFRDKRLGGCRRVGRRVMRHPRAPRELPLTDPTPAAQWRPMLTPAIQAPLIPARSRPEAPLPGGPASSKSPPTSPGCRPRSKAAKRPPSRPRSTSQRPREEEVARERHRLPPRPSSPNTRPSSRSLRKTTNTRPQGHEGTEKAIGDPGGPGTRGHVCNRRGEETCRRRGRAEGQHRGPRGAHQDPRERETSLTAELTAAQAEVAAARAPVEPLRLRHYDRVAARQMPGSPVRDAAAAATRLREVESAAQGQRRK